MFSKILDEMTLTSDASNQVFRNIQCDSFNGDNTFLATLRALLLPRVGKDDVLVRRTSSDFRADPIRNNGVRAVINAGLDDLDSAALHIHDVKSRNDDDRAAMFEVLDDPNKGFVCEFSGFTELVPIRQFVSKEMNVRVYTNKESKTTIIFVERLNIKRWHFIQAFLPRYFEWYFNTSPVNEEEQALLRSLIVRSSSDYERIIEEIANKFDMRSYVINNVIGGIERRARRSQLDAVERDIQDTRNDIESIMARYSELIDRLDAYNIRRIGIMDIINNASDDSELVEYFRSNKSLEPLSSSETRFNFIVKTVLDSWDPELFETMVNKDTSHLYSGYSIGHQEFRTIEARRKFFNAIFSDDPKLRIKLCGLYILDLRGSSSSSSGYHFPRSCSDRLPNPHLHFFNCLGNYQRAINGYLRDGDAVGAVEQCVASCKSINLAEPPTVQRFFEILFRTNADVIELPDHSSVTTVKALEWLNAQDAEKEEKDA